jgi:hypothetical protein
MTMTVLLQNTARMACCTNPSFLLMRVNGYTHYLEQSSMHTHTHTHTYTHRTYRVHSSPRQKSRSWGPSQCTSRSPASVSGLHSQGNMNTAALTKVHAHTHTLTHTTCIPPDSLVPSFPISVSYFISSVMINAWICAVLHASTTRASRSASESNWQPYATLSMRLRSNK